MRKREPYPISNMVNNVLQLDNLHLVSVLVRQNGLILDRAMCSCSANVVNTIQHNPHIHKYPLYGPI